MLNRPRVTSKGRSDGTLSHRSSPHTVSVPELFTENGPELFRVAVSPVAKFVITTFARPVTGEWTPPGRLSSALTTVA
jgi:hypothetical protein